MALFWNLAMFSFPTALDVSVLSCICTTAASLVRSRDKVRARLHFLAGPTGLAPGSAPQSSGLCRRERHRVGALGAAYSADSTSG